MNKVQILLTLIRFLFSKKKFIFVLYKGVRNKEMVEFARGPTSKKGRNSFHEMI